MSESKDVTQERLKVFISYSRKDSESFADELVAGLEFAGNFNVTIDRHSIVEGEDWKKRLGALIADADTVVFVISPESAASPICQWEVDEAVKISKRILPVLWLPVGANPVPEKLAALNYTRFDEGRSFMAGLKGLITALNTDLDWLREHTRLLARAMEWDRGGRAANRLMSGKDISEAKAWAAKRPRNAPELTAFHLDFIKASESAETHRFEEEKRNLETMRAAQEAREAALAKAEEAQTAREAEVKRRASLQRFLVAGATAAAIIFGAFSVYSYRLSQKEKEARELTAAALEQAKQSEQSAEERRVEALQAKSSAEAERNNAVAAKQEAESEKQRAEREKERAETESKRAAAAADQAEMDRDLAQEGQSIFLAELSRTSFKEGNILRSMLLSVEALPDVRRGMKRPIVREALDLALTNYYDLATKPIGAGGVESCTAIAMLAGGERLIALYGSVAEIVALPSLKTEARLSGHIGKLTSLAAAKSALVVATASEDNTARIWDASQGKLIAVLSGHTATVRDVDLDPTGQRAITASDDGVAIVWNATNGRPIARFARHGGPAVLAKLSPDGKLALTANNTGQIWVWNADNGESIGTLDEEGGGSVAAVAFYPNGSRILVARSYGNPAAFEANSLKKVAAFDYSDSINTVAFNHDGTRVAFGAAFSSESVVFDAVSGQRAFSLENYSETVLDMAFSKDGAILVTGSDDDTARIWNARNGKALGTIETKKGDYGADVSQVAVLADGHSIVGRTGDGLVVWNGDSGKPISEVAQALSSNDHVLLAPKGDAMLRIADNGPVKLWNISPEGLKERPVLRQSGGRSSTASISPDTRWVAAGTTDDRLGVWRGDVLEEVKTFDAFPAERIAFSASGELLAAATRSRILTASDVNGNTYSEAAGSAIGGQFGLSIGLTASDDGKRIAIGDGGQLVRLWETSGPKPRLLATLQDEQKFSNAEFVADGRHLFTLSGGGNAKLWETEKGTLAFALSDRVVKYAILAKKSLLAGVLRDGTIDVWSLVNGERLFNVPFPEGMENSRDSVYLDANRDGTVFSVHRYGSGSVEVWDADKGVQISTLNSGTDSVYGVTLSGDGSRAIIKNDKDQFSTWDVAQGTKIFATDAKKKLDWDYGDLNEKGTRLLLRRADRSILVDPETGAAVGEIASDGDTYISFTTKGSTITVQSSNGAVDVRSAEDGAILKVLREPSGGRELAVWSDDDSRIVISNGKNAARLFDGRNGEPIADLVLDASQTVVRIDFSPDGSKVLTFGKDGVVTQWDSETGERLKDIQMAADAVDFKVSPDGSRIFSIRADVRATVIATHDWTEQAAITAHTDAVTSLSFDRAGKRLLTSSSDGTAAMWDASDGRRMVLFQARASETDLVSLFEAVLSPDEKLVATAASGGKLTIWNAETGERIADSDGGGDLSGIKFNAVSTHVTASRSGSGGGAIVWEIQGKSLIERFTYPDVIATAFTPDGTGFAVFKSRSMQIFDIVSGKSRQSIDLEKASTEYGDGPFDGLMLSEDGHIATSSKSGAVWAMKWTLDDIGDHMRAMLPRCLLKEERAAVHLGAEPPDWCIELGKWPYDAPEWKAWLEEKKAGKNSPMPGTQQVSEELLIAK